jgi:rRNA maturation RNase YbeY
LKYLHVFDSQKVIDKRKIHLLVKELSHNLSFQLVSLEINIISSDEIISLNKKHLKHDYTTDILTFNYSSKKALLDAEIFISVDDAKSNSKKFKVSFNEEIGRLVIHGILHLLGFDDRITSEKKVMKRLENKLLSSFKFILL